MAKGNIVLEPEVAHSLSAMTKEDRQQGREDPLLTPREMEVLELVSARAFTTAKSPPGYTSSEGTVRNYVTSLLEKLHLRDCTQLAIYYLKRF